MKGLRTPETNKFMHFFKIVQDEAAKQGAVFFLDNGEGHTFEDDQIECEDLCGWLIPFDKADDFSKEFENGDSDLDEWSDYIAFAEWEANHELRTITIKIRQY